jgi:hypothetical protein
MTTNTPILRVVPSMLPAASRSVRLHNVRRFSMTHPVGAKSSPLFDLNGLANSREAQHLSKERSIPRTEFMPTLQMIRSGEVDPYAPAPGSSVRGTETSEAAATANAAAAVHYNRSKNVWSNEDTPLDASAVSPVAPGSGLASAVGRPGFQGQSSSAQEPAHHNHSFTERLGVALLFGSLTLGGLMLWGPDLWVVKPDRFNRFVDERLKADYWSNWWTSGYGGSWMKFWDDKARTVTEKGSEHGQKLNLDRHAETLDGVVRPRMEKLGSAIRKNE